jgi:hypothetical protein
MEGTYTELYVVLGIGFGLLLKSRDQTVQVVVGQLMIGLVVERRWLVGSRGCYLRFGIWWCWVRGLGSQTFA